MRVGACVNLYVRPLFKTKSKLIKKSDCTRNVPIISPVSYSELLNLVVQRNM